ncbi:MAG TPA: protein kinase [Ktedonobacteraceae bacterium]|jgi:serine/threonine protein kinase|nr:protein kinase [Ktedonobacteraceae bacterium]
MTSREGEQLGNYRLTRLLGQGGFAEVYLGEHIYIQRQAAVKVLHARLAEDAVADFQHEAQIIADLRHPHIITIFDFDIHGNLPLLVMDYCPEGSLRKRHPRGTRVPLATVVTYVEQMAGALDFAHERRLIHRDVKPENMLIGQRGEIVLSDFGIATVAHSTSSMSRQAFAGTPHYMAPEQIREYSRPATDQYALGIVVYEWLTGTPPFRGTATEVFAKQLTIEPPPLRESVPDLGPAVEQVVLRALAKDPARRFPTVQAFASALAEAARVPRASDMPASYNIGLENRASWPPQIAQPLTNGANIGPFTGLSEKEALPGSSSFAPPKLPGSRGGDGPTDRLVAVDAMKVGPIKKRRGPLTLFVLLGTLLLIGGLTFFTIGKFGFTQGSKAVSSTMTAGDHVSIQATATAQAMTRSATATPIQATARPLPTPTSIPENTHPYPGYLPGHGQFVVYDPVTNAAHWETGPNSDNSGFCEFSDSHDYHATMSKKGYRWCHQSIRAFSDFAYEVQVTIVSGDCAGIFFRVDKTTFNGYTFVICQWGEEDLYKWAPNGSLQLIEGNTSAAIKQGLNQSNMLAVVAQGSTISLFVNSQQVDQQQDSSSLQGVVGVAAVDGSHPTDAIFKGVTIWTL